MIVKIVKFIAFLIVIIIITCLMIIGEVQKIPGVSSIAGLIAGILLPLFGKSFEDLFDNENWKSSQRKLQRAHLLNKDSKIRISFAYLYRIKVEGKYFLLKSKRTNKYQPVGGAYKLNKKEVEFLTQEI